MKESTRAKDYMHTNRFPAVFELAHLATELEEEVNSLRKEVDLLNHQLKEKDSVIADLESQFYSYDSSDSLLK